MLKIKQNIVNNLFNLVQSDNSGFKSQEHPYLHN